MSVRIARFSASLLFAMGTLAAGFFARDMSQRIQTLPVVPAELMQSEDHEIATSKSSEGHGGGGHGAAPAAEHGGGGGHGAPAASGGHGASSAAAAPSNLSPILSVDEIYANIAGEGNRTHSFALKVELELFEEKHRTLLEERASVIRSTILETARQNDYRSLSSLSGKLYFKEVLVSRINEALGGPAIRDVHFSSFYLQ